MCIRDRYKSYVDFGYKPYKRGNEEGLWVITSEGIRYCDFRPVEIYWRPPVQEGDSRESIVAAIDQNNRGLTELESRI